MTKRKKSIRISLEGILPASLRARMSLDNDFHSVHAGTFIISCCSQKCDVFSKVFHQNIGECVRMSNDCVRFFQ
jgi:hypothetical protein